MEEAWVEKVKTRIPEIPLQVTAEQYYGLCGTIIWRNHVKEIMPHTAHNGHIGTCGKGRVKNRKLARADYIDTRHKKGTRDGNGINRTKSLGHTTKAPERRRKYEYDDPHVV
jgi:hypothetical protein